MRTHGVTDFEQLPDDTDDNERLELYVLNLLDDDEMAAVERRIAADPTARERVRELRSSTALLAFDLEPMAPAPSVKERLLSAARADIASESSASPAPFPTPTDAKVGQPAAAPPISITQARAARSANWMPWSLAAALAIALIGSLLWNANLRGELDERTEAVAHAVQTSGDQASADGEVVVLDGDGVALLTLSGLPALKPGQVYQVWLIADGAPQPNVTFSPSNQGFANVAVAGPVVEYRTLAVTVEPVGGSTAPTTEPTIISDLTEPADG